MYIYKDEPYYTMNKKTYIYIVSKKNDPSECYQVGYHIGNRETFSIKCASYTEELVVLFFTECKDAKLIIKNFQNFYHDYRKKNALGRPTNWYLLNLSDITSKLYALINCVHFIDHPTQSCILI